MIATGPRPKKPSYQAYILEIPASQHNTRHIISAVYIPPCSSDALYIEYLNKLQNAVNVPSVGSYFIAGDFNRPDIDGNFKKSMLFPI